MSRVVLSIVTLILAFGLVVPLVDEASASCAEKLSVCSGASEEHSEREAHSDCTDLCILAVCSHVLLPRTTEPSLDRFGSGTRRKVSSPSDAFILSVFLDTPSEPPKHV